MENATQALIIAAGVLIGVIILSMAVFLFSTMGSYVSNTQQKIDQNRLDQFNDKFLEYNGKTDLTIQDIVTVKNYALENNRNDQNYNYKTDRAAENNEYIDVFFGNTKAMATIIWGTNDKIVTDQELLEKEIQLSIENNNNRLFTCEVNINTNTGKVNKIYFYETNNGI